jgi:fibronectin type 3 domain-containing protein
MQSSITSFNQNTLALWNGSKYPTAFAGHLETLSSNTGPSILTASNYQGFLQELNGLKAIGATAVVIDLAYPALDPNFDSWGGQSANYLSLYKQAVADIRSRGLKIIIETTLNQAVISTVNVTPYYQSQSLTTYMNGRAQQALLIAQQLQPDYLVIMEEPDNESAASGHPELYTYSGSIAFLKLMLGVLRGANVTVPLSAGIGTWLPNDSQGKSYSDYISGYASTSLDAIDIHVYPVVKDDLTRLYTIASLAKGASKKLTMSEAWSYKQRASELTMAPDVIYARDVYSFWAPIDTQFLQALVNYSYYEQLDFMAAFWAAYFRAYLTWDPVNTCCQSTTTLFSSVWTLQGQALQSGSYTTTGNAWEDMIVSAPDKTPPDPSVVTATNVYPNQVVLSWTWPNDNVGVAKFSLTRSGTSLTTTTLTSYSDTGLSDGKTYNYVVTAYDAKGNATQSQPLPVTTPDITKPTPPTWITPTMLSNTSVSLAWGGATDNVAVTGYGVYRGANGATPTWFASPSSSPYVDSTLVSAVTYCYYVVAVDAVPLPSSAGPTVCITTNDTKAPTIPANVAASGTTAPTVSVAWSPSTDKVGISGYNVQRLVNGVSGSVIATGVTGTSFVDRTASPLPDSGPPSASIKAPLSGATVNGSVAFTASATDTGTKTTYTYQVNAVDPAGNVSGWSAGSSVAWPTNTSGVADVKFLVDGTVVQDLTVSPYSFVWDTTKCSLGNHTLTVVATDGAGNKATSSPISVTVVDQTAPTVPSNLTATAGTGTNVNLAWSASTDAYAVAGYSIQRKTNATGTYATVLSGIKPNGAVDTAAAPLPDTAAPTASIKSPIANATVTGSTAFTASVYDNGTVTTYVYQVAAFDPSNNVSPWSVAAAVTLPVNTSGLAGVRFLVDGVDVVPEVTASPYSVIWNSATVKDGSHALTIIARDKAGNTTTSAPLTITVKNGPPTPAGLTGTGTSPSPVALSWSASTDANGVSGYNIQRKLSTAAGYSALASQLSGTSFTDSTATLSPDTAAPTASVYAPLAGAKVTGTVSFQASVADTGTKTSYNYQVAAVDKAGNTSPWSQGVTVTYGTNTSGLAGVRFQVDGVDAVPEVTISPYYISWNTAAVTDGTHILTVIARDSAGNKATSAPISVTVENAPSVPTSLAGSGTTPAAVRLSWTASTDASGVTGYQVFRKLSTASSYTLIASAVVATSFSDATVSLLPDKGAPSASVWGITSGSTVSGTVTFSSSVYDTGTTTTYYYQISAFDAAGNVSNPSPPIAVNYGTSTSGIANVRFLVDGVDAASPVTTSPYYIPWNTKTVANGSHTLTVVAKDVAGNTTTSAPVTVTVAN